jgi:hypothetical protein
MGELKLAKLPEDVRLFIYRVTLHLQASSSKTPEQHECMFREAYRLYSRYDVENRRADERKERENENHG